ncbi:hypothetical protein Tco_0498785, partial [Tanacetum coccineum]
PSRNATLDDEEAQVKMGFALIILTKEAQKHMIKGQEWRTEERVNRLEGSVGCYK